MCFRFGSGNRQKRQKENVDGKNCAGRKQQRKDEDEDTTRLRNASKEEVNRG